MNTVLSHEQQTFPLERTPPAPPGHVPGERTAVPSTSTGSGKDLRNLDVLRAVAVLMVVVSHVIAVCAPRVPLHRYGAFGVALFFVHTALVLLWSLERRPTTVDFYIRRALRIYPLSMLTTFLVVATHAPVSVGRGTGYFVYAHLSAMQIVEHFLLVQNLFSGNQLLYVMWSLPLEVQMYTVLPVLFFFLQSNRRLWPLLLFWTVTWTFCLREFSGSDLNLMFSVCYFLPGVMAYAGFRRGRATLPGSVFLVVLAGLVLWGGNAANWRIAALPALALGLVLPWFRQLPVNTLTRAAWYIARYSYGIYLLHPICLVVAFYLLPRQHLAVQLAVFLGTLVASSLAAFHLVEEPCIRLGGKLAARYARSLVIPSAQVAA